MLRKSALDGSGCSTLPQHLYAQPSHVCVTNSVVCSLSITLPAMRV